MNEGMNVQVNKESEWMQTYDFTYFEYLNVCIY